MTLRRARNRAWRAAPRACRRVHRRPWRPPEVPVVEGEHLPSWTPSPAQPRRARPGATTMTFSLSKLFRTDDAGHARGYRWQLGSAATAEQNALPPGAARTRSLPLRAAASLTQPSRNRTDGHGLVGDCGGQRLRAEQICAQSRFRSAARASGRPTFVRVLRLSWSTTCGSARESAAIAASTDARSALLFT